MIVVNTNNTINEYPDSISGFSPSEHFPEYIWGENEICKTYNPVYELVRNTFFLAELDTENYGTKDWNPLGEYIQPGQTVLIKPNWVENKNPETDDNLACLVTNPSVVRPIIDYVAIALNGKGKIIIADAPMQGCDLSELFSISGYDKLFQFYKKVGLDITVVDLRKYSVESVRKGVVSKPVTNSSKFCSKEVFLNEDSMHAEKDCINPEYKVEDYSKEQTAQYHSNGVHSYEVNELVLLADVIINMPKPKTHRLAGFTAACKNFVGVTYEKACLPHRIDSDQERNSGDAYQKYSIFKKRMNCFNERRTYYSKKGAYTRAKIYDILMKSFYFLGTLETGDKYRIGSWYGNDTIWRTAVDLNNICLHSNKDGLMKQSKQRQIIHIGDMIISGQKNGPVKPSPKQLGMILFSDNALLFDRVVCEIMGFDADRFPAFNNQKSLAVFNYNSRNALDQEIVVSNDSDINKKQVEQFSVKKEWFFEAHPAWKGHIEKNCAR